jgi:hypothetical protein
MQKIKKIIEVKSGATRSVWGGITTRSVGTIRKQKLPG